jgi:mannose-6-phosphate isomerase-like protein (cupin superfamily)
MKHKILTGERLSKDDLATLTREISDGQTVRSEDFSNDVYLDEVIDKPWGLEYRVYADMLVDVWRLSINSGYSTSMHCHPRKNTVLLCLGGYARVNFLKTSILLAPGDFTLISKGVFHSTDSSGDGPAELIEVETPRNKFDLVRARDKYGRDGQRYESEKSGKAITPMKSLGCATAGAKIRPHDMQRSFNFAVATGREIRSNQTSDRRFAISLSLKDAIEQNIDIVSLPGQERLMLKNQPYLLVSRGTTDAGPLTTNERSNHV